MAKHAASLPRFLFLASFLLLPLTSCDTIDFRPYDYNKREKAKLELPKGSAVELEGRSFILKKKMDFPYWGK